MRFKFVEETGIKEPTLTDFINSRDFYVVLVDDVRDFNLREYQHSIEVDDEPEEDEESKEYYESLLEDDSSNKNTKYVISKKDVQNLIEKIAKSNFFVANYYKTRKFMKDENLSEDDIKAIVKQLGINDYSYSMESKSFKPGDTISVFITNKDFKVNGKNLSGLTIYIELDLDYGDIAAIISVHRERKTDKRFPKNNPYM